MQQLSMFNYKPDKNDSSYVYLSESQKQRLIEIKNLYDQCGTLEETAKKLGLTRERVRQLLEKGQKKKLFNYETTRVKKFKDLISKISKEDLEIDIKNGITRPEIYGKYDIDEHCYQRLIKYYKIDTQDFQNEYRYKKYLNRYSDIVNELGHHPSTTEMQREKRRNWRATYVAITRLWGNMDKFRQTYGIEKPDHTLHPNTIIGFRKGRETRQTIKKEKIENIKNFIANHKVVTFKMTIEEFGYSVMSTSSYLQILLENKEIKRFKKNTTYYYLPNI
jgi:hypothetical protein